MATVYPTGSAIRRAFAVLREEGLTSFWFKLASTVGYRRLLLLDRPLAEAVPQIELGQGLDFGTLAISEVDAHLAFRPELSRAIVLDRLRSAQACFYARHEGRIVSACWATKQSAWIEFLGCEFTLAPGEVYVFDAYTVPLYRGQGVAPALCLHQLSHFRQEGLRRAIRATLPENIPALRAHAKSGFRTYALLRSLRIGPWQFCVERPWQHRAAMANA
jgi:ribosomal protein S18 acetylase RimI-like enzyme